MHTLLYVNAWGYELFDFYVPDSAKEDDIKEQISIRIDVSANKLHLFENGKPFLLMTPRPTEIIKLTCFIDASESNTINLRISHLSPTVEHYITVPQTHTIRQIKELMSINPDDTGAYINYKQYDNDIQMTDIPNCSHIHIAPTNYQIGTPNQQIFVKPQSNITLVFNINANQPVSDLQEMMEIRYGVSKDEIMFSHSGRILQCHMTFCDLRIGRDATVIAVCRARGGSGIIPIGSTSDSDPPVKAKKKSKL
jgi:hypothetical protein